MRTDENAKAICEQLTLLVGDMYKACRAVGVSPQFVMRWMKDDKEFAAQVEEAQRVGYMQIESEIVRRAVHGVEEPVFYQGNVCGHKTVYSDALLGRLAEANVPKYKKGEGGNTFNGPTQINFMPRAESYEQWLSMKDATLARRDAPALPAPREGPDLLVGEYVDFAPAAVQDRPLATLDGLL